MLPGSCSIDALVAALEAPVEPEFAGAVVVVGPGRRRFDEDRAAAAMARLESLPCIVVGEPGWCPIGTELSLLDMTVADDGELARVIESAAVAPIAAASLALHLRGSSRRGVADGLVAESALFSALQAGREHRTWRQGTPRRERPSDDRSRVGVRRAGSVLHVTLRRPEVHNALDVRMRDELLEAFAIAEADPTLQVILRGEGASFCSGGDLDEFGTTPDPATAHVIRLRRSLAVAIHRIGDRTTVHLQGACAGSGVELAAFAATIVAAANTTLALPELGLGLVPGAGGTVSLTRRIGRHRVAWMALTGLPIDVRTARAWNLVDEIVLT